jgi:hypothetical protein
MICKSGRRTTLFKPCVFLIQEYPKITELVNKKHAGWSKLPMYLIKSYKINIKSSFVRMKKKITFFPVLNHVKPSGSSSSLAAPASPPSPPPAAAPAPPPPPPLPPPQAANLPKPLVISSWALVVKHFWVG